jgi:hypothetical protein
MMLFALILVSLSSTNNFAGKISTLAHWHISKGVLAIARDPLWGIASKNTKS